MPKKDSAKKESALKAQNGASYNNLIPGLAANPYRHVWSHFGTSHALEILQFPDLGIGGVLWDCELVLVAWMCSAGNSSRFNGATAVELGAGTGLAALVAWKLGSFAVATDLPDIIATITAPNAQHNTAAADKRRRAAYAAATLSWGVDSDADAVVAMLPEAPRGKRSDATAPQRRLDFILAADVVYHSDDHMPLLDTILRIAQPGVTRVVFVHRVRVNNDGNFVEPLKDALELLKATPVADVLPAYPKDNLTIYEFVCRARTNSRD